MRRYYVVSGILLVLPIIDFAVTAPVLVQEKRQASVDAITMLGKRGDELNWLRLTKYFENYFPKPEESSAARPSSSSPPSGPADGWTDITQPQPSIPEEPSPVSSPDRDHAPPKPGSLTETGYESMKGDAPPGPSTESDHDLTGVHAPLSSPVFSTWFHPDHGLMGAHVPQPNLGPSNPSPLTGSDSDHRLVAEEPPSRPASPTEFDADH
jgi:hypothetical protein